MSGVTYSAVYSFGDSLSDAGNAYLLTSSKLLTSSAVGVLLGDPGQSLGAVLGDPPEPISPPYASERYGSVTADVFSDGPVWLQDLSQALELPALEPSGIVVTDQEVSAALGVSVSDVASTIFPLLAALHLVTNFGTYAVVAGGGNASGGSPTDFAVGGSVTGPTGANSAEDSALTDLSAQYQTFRILDPAPVGNALYTVWSGSNDMIDLLDDGLDATTGAADISQSVTQELDFIQTLIGGGAQNVLVATVPDLGLTPAGQGEAAAASGLAQSFNTQLLAGLVPLEQSATITVLDSYGLVDDAVANPGSFGLTNVTDPLWTGNYEGQNGTLAATGAAADGYLFFDEMHPTEQGQSMIADAALTALGVPCYLSGTRLATRHGMRRIETIRVGDRLRMAGGGERPVTWVGHRRLAHPAAREMWPVCFRAGAIGDGVPARDLLVSPKHAMFLDGVLVPAELLVNGVSVVRREPAADLTYFHVELDGHDILLAEGAPAESFVDRDSRVLFENSAARRGGEPAADCAPRVEDGAVLEAVRRRLAARAGLAADHAGDAAVPGVVEGRIDRLDGSAVAGWAFDATRPHTPVRLEVLVDGATVATCVASGFRADLQAAGKGDGRCAFAVRLGSPVADRAVQVRRADEPAGTASGRAAAPDRPGRLDGFVDVCDDRTVEGWALDVDAPGVPVRLEIVEGARVIGTVSANAYRHDLAQAGKAGGWCSFVFRFDAAARPADAGRIAVRRASDGAAVSRPAAPRLAA